MTEDEIMKTTQPFVLFDKDKTVAKKQFHDLARVWHPDVNKSKNSAAVFSHINQLYDVAFCKNRVNKEFHTDFDSFTIDILKKYSFELGETYVGEDLIVYELHKEFNNFLVNFKKQEKMWRFATPRMEKEFKPLLPEIKYEGENVLAIKKTSTMFCLQDVYAYYKGKMDPKHVAWIVSRLYNIACYLEYSKIGHNAILLENLYISPELHYVYLLGGWWYACPFGTKMLHLPKSLYDILPAKTRVSKLANGQLDLEAIRLVGRTLLGDASGVTLSEPKPMIDWFQSASSTSAVDEYGKWNEVLLASFGPKRFTKMELSSIDLYGG